MSIPERIMASKRGFFDGAGVFVHSDSVYRGALESQTTTRIGFQLGIMLTISKSFRLHGAHVPARDFVSEKANCWSRDTIGIANGRTGWDSSAGLKERLIRALC